MRACFLFPFQNEYDQYVGACLRLFLAHFTTLFRMVTKVPYYRYCFLG